MPSSKPNVDHPGNKVLAQIIISDPLLFQIWEYHTEIHYRFKFGRPLDPKCDFLRLEGKIIKTLNERMGNTANACSDSNILCVLGLTTNGTLRIKQPDRSKWPSQGPLTSLNGLDTLGRLPSVQEHIRGLDSLVKMRGGFLKITTAGIAPMLSMYVLWNVNNAEIC
jgi:hypothetical protein